MPWGGWLSQRKKGNDLENLSKDVRRNLGLVKVDMWKLFTKGNRAHIKWGESRKRSHQVTYTNVGHGGVPEEVISEDKDYLPTPHTNC